MGCAAGMGSLGVGGREECVEGTGLLAAAQGWGSAQGQSEAVRAEHLATTVFKLRLGLNRAEGKDGHRHGLWSLKGVRIGAGC